MALIGTQARRHFKAGDTILQQGEQGDRAYIIESGEVEILIEKADGKIHHVGNRGEGTIIGEMAIVDDAPRTATVKAVKDCEMLEITREDFSRRLKTADPVLQTVMHIILMRYRDVLTRAQIFGESSTFPPPEELERRVAMKADAVETIKIANEFKAALESGQLALHYQPIINLRSGKVEGFEALMRWEHPERGFISPGVFIPVAEETGLIVSASCWALKEACSALRRIENRTGHNDDLFMSVNFSSEDFASENFVETVYNTLSASDVRAKQVHLEITERVLMGQPENARDTLEMCRKAGMGIAIDDFGTGYSSLSYLHYFPIDTLKIDRSFVMGMTKDENSLQLVKSIIGLGKNMRMKIIAEGVETEQEAVTLSGLGCDLAQGYHFSRPLSEKEVTTLLREWKPVRMAG